MNLVGVQPGLYGWVLVHDASGPIRVRGEDGDPGDVGVIPVVAAGADDGHDAVGMQ
jgi:hypothetical protein